MLKSQQRDIFVLMERLITTLVWAAIIQGVLLAGLYLFNKKHRSLANQLLGFFLLVIVYEATLTFLPLDHIFGYPINYYFSLPEVKLFYPVLFLHYILEKVGRARRYRKVLRIHYLLAFAIAGIFLLNLFLFVFKGTKIEDYFESITLENAFMAQQYYAFLLIIIVLVISLKEVKHYKTVIQNQYSDYGMLNINWLWRFIFVIIPIIILWGANLVHILLGGRHSFDYELVTWGFVVIMIYFVSFQAYKHKNLFEGVEGVSEPVDAISSKNGKSKKPSSKSIELNREDETVIRQIKHHMETQEPYLDASLSMYQLAKQVNMPVPELSQLINHKLNKHFFDFVNEYRVKKAMEILRNPDNSKMTVLEVLYEVGFNSKSSFNTVFKKYTGKTPTQYRKSHSLTKE